MSHVRGLFSLGSVINDLSMSVEAGICVFMVAILLFVVSLISGLQYYDGISSDMNSLGPAHVSDLILAIDCGSGGLGLILLLFLV